MAAHSGHPSLRVLVLPYPLEGRPDEEVRQIAADAYPRLLRTLGGVTTTTSSVFPYLIVNGPSRDRVGIDYQNACMGGAAGRGSMAIGRAVSLCLRNIGGQKAGPTSGATSKSVFGQPGRLGVCF